MIELKVPKIRARRVQGWVQVTIDNGIVTCADNTLRRAIEDLKPPGGFPTDVPEPDWALGDLCRSFLAARIVRRTPNGNGRKPRWGVVE